MFCEKGVLRNFAKFTGKHLCQSLFFNKVAGAASEQKQSTGRALYIGLLEEYNQIHGKTILDKVTGSQPANLLKRDSFFHKFGEFF